MRRLNWVAPLALGMLVCVQASATEKTQTPPPELAAYIAAARKADAIADPLQRCLAYPDLPGSTWTPGVAKARCVMFNTPPIFTLDSLEAALAEPDGAKAVDAKFAALLDAHYTVPEQREQIFIGLRIFKSLDRDRAERIARAWLAASPDSAFAQTALGHVLVARGLDARGTKYARETPAEDMRTMGKFFGDAGQHYATALKANTKLLPACVGLMVIGRYSDDVVQNTATKWCIDADPASYHVVDELMNAAETRWGGSDEQMRAIAAYAQARTEQDPVLAVFAFHHAYYDIERDSDDGDARALAVLEPAALQVPNAAYIRRVGDVYVNKKDWWKAFAWKSQAVRFAPEYDDEWRLRGYVQYRLGDSAGARSDVEHALALDANNLRAHGVLGDVLRNTGHPADARQHYARAMDVPSLRKRAFIANCASAIEAKQEKEAPACVDRLLAEYPDNGEAWRLRLTMIGPDSPQSDEAMRRFLATQDPEQWPAHKEVAERVRKLLAAKDGTASADEMFEVRVMRAGRLERSKEGRDFFSTFLPATNAAFNDVMTACFAPRCRTTRTASPP
jgi:tetratricopeptide (TPR) repeat protein